MRVASDFSPPKPGNQAMIDGSAPIHHLVYSLSTRPLRVVVRITRKVLSRQIRKLASHADQHEQFFTKVTYCVGVLLFGSICYLLGARPQEIPYLYCAFYVLVIPLRWIYYRMKKWHYYLLDFCYYANAIFVTILLFFRGNEKLFMLCFSFSEGPLAWALIVWRCSLVFNSVDKIISLLIHLLPGTVFFILRWWEPEVISEHALLNHGSKSEASQQHAWPVVESASTLWTWFFFVPLLVYFVWQALYFLVVEGLRRKRISKDPEIKTSYRELKRKAERANNIWWHLSGLLGDERRVVMYAVIQAAFTVATLAFTVPMFMSYRLHMSFEMFKISAAVWNGGKYVFDVMPQQFASSKKMDSAELKVTHLHHHSVTAPMIYNHIAPTNALDSGSISWLHWASDGGCDHPSKCSDRRCVICRKSNLSNQDNGESASAVSTNAF